MSDYYTHQKYLRSELSPPTLVMRNKKKFSFLKKNQYDVNSYTYW